MLLVAVNRNPTSQLHVVVVLIVPGEFGISQLTHFELSRMWLAAQTHFQVVEFEPISSQPAGQPHSPLSESANQVKTRFPQHLHAVVLADAPVEVEI